jgi:hypothetical protein
VEKEQRGRLWISCLKTVRKFPTVADESDGIRSVRRNTILEISLAESSGETERGWEDASAAASFSYGRVERR